MTVTGTAWVPCELDPEPSPVTVEWLGVADSAIRVEVDAEGGFTTSVTVPEAGVGPAALRVSHSAIEPVELPFTITE